MFEATVESLKSSRWPMFVAVSPFPERLTKSNFTSIEMAFLFSFFSRSNTTRRDLTVLMSDNEGQNISANITQTKVGECTTIKYGVHPGTNPRCLMYMAKAASRKKII